MTLLRTIVLATLALAGTQALAQSYPVRPIRWVVPFAPGGGTDIVARILAPALADVLGQQLVVDNRAGAAGNIALEIVANSAPDGYTVLIGNVSTSSINETLFAKTLRVKPSQQLFGVTLLAAIPNLVVAGAAFPANTLAEAIAYAKARPGQLNFSSPLGGYSHLDMLDLNARAGIRMVNVPSKGAGSSLASIISGEIHFSIINAASATPQVKGGRMKAFATTSAKRLADLPDVPTLAEAGYPGVGSDNWNALFVPARTPRALVDRLHAAVREAQSRPAVQAALAKSSVPPALSASPEEFQKFVQSETQKWARIIKDNDIRVE